MISKIFALPVGPEICFWDLDKDEYVVQTITQEYAERLVYFTNQAISNWSNDAPEGLSKILPPVLSEHKRDGKRFGDILHSELMGDGAKYGVYLTVDWLDSTWEDIQNDETQHVSIGTSGKYKDYKGRDYPVIINEVSITGDPRLKNIGKIQDTLSLRLVDVIPKTTGEDMSQEEMLALFDAMLKRVEALEASNAELKAMLEEKAKDEDPASEDAPKEDAALSEDELKDEEEIVAMLSDSLIKKAQAKAVEKLKGMRLGEVPANQAPKIDTRSKLDQAKAKGLTGLAAIRESLK